MDVPNVFGAAVVAVAGAKLDTAGMMHQTGPWFLVSIGFLLLLEWRLSRRPLGGPTAPRPEGACKGSKGSESS